MSKCSIAAGVAEATARLLFVLFRRGHQTAGSQFMLQWVAFGIGLTFRLPASCLLCQFWYVNLAKPEIGVMCKLDDGLQLKGTLDLDASNPNVCFVYLRSVRLLEPLGVQS